MSTSLVAGAGSGGGAGGSLGDMPKKPAPGKVGQAIMVRTNFYPIPKLHQGALFHYHLSVTPSKQYRPPFLRRLFGLWQQRHGRQVGLCAFDGRANLYAPRRLQLGPQNVQDFPVEVTDEDGTRPQTFTLHLQLVAELPMEALHRFLAGRQADCPSDVLQALEIGMRHLASTRYLGIGANFYMSERSYKLSGGGELWQGAHASLRPGQGRLLLNVDVAATAFYEAGPVLHFIANCLNRPPGQLQQPLNAREIEVVGRRLRGLQIQINHRGAMRRKYRVNGLTPTSANRTMFLVEEGEGEGAMAVERSVAWYFQTRYGMTLRSGNLNCLSVGDPAKRIYLPLEVCDVVAGQRIPNRLLDERQTADIIKLTCVQPLQRRDRIQENLRLLGCDPRAEANPYIQEFGLQPNPEMLSVPARVLPVPKVLYHPSSKEPSIVPSMGAWNLRGVQVARGATLAAWGVVDFAGVGEGGLAPFLKELVITCNDTGMKITNKAPPIRRGTVQDVERSIVAMHRAIKGVQLIVCILPTTDAAVYGEIKRVSDTVLGIPTQCLQAKHTRTPKKQYCANVCLKLNAKLGGMNAHLAKDALPFVSAAPTIVFGADVTHPAPGEDKPSICAVVGSLDAQCVSFAGLLTAQSSRVEVISRLEEMVMELLKAFYSRTKFKPTRILFYRDGVGEGQFAQVRDQEVQSIRRACARLEAGYQPTITFVVVQKRHHARFFPQSAKDADRSGNCKPGTLVEREICTPSYFDFYLLSHAGLQGTSRPTHYQVLVDENRFTADALQELTYRMCYTYARATRSVSVCPPAYYAHLLAFRARFHGEVRAEAPPGGAGASRTAEPVLAFATPVLKALERSMYYM